jgi:hypothetical protein
MEGVLMRVRKWRPSSAMVVAVLALFVSLGGVGYAATQLPRNSVGTPQLRSRAVTAAKLANNAVTSRKVADHSLLAKDFRSGQLPSGRPGQQGPQGPQGPPGAAGSDATVNGVAAGGDLAGTYPNPSIGAGKVDAIRLADGSVTSAKFAPAAVAPDASQLGGIGAAGFVQGGGTAFSGHPDSTPAGGGRTIFTIPNVISVGGQCTSSGGNSDVFVEDIASGNVFLWKMVAGQAATSLTLTPFDPMNPGADTDFGPVTPVSHVTWQGTSSAGTFLVEASAFSNGTVCHFSGSGIENP